jgi:hypothetical protein
VYQKSNSTLFTIGEKAMNSKLRGALSIAMMCLAVVIQGCASVSGYKISSVDGGRVRLQSVKGLPISVQNPTHALFIVKETTFGIYEQSVPANPVGAPDAAAGPAPAPGTLPAPAVGRGIRIGSRMDLTLINQAPILLGKAELYSIDVKRPAAGTIDYSLELQNQYPTKITGKVDDKTIDAVSNAISKLMQDSAKLAAGPGPVQKQSGGTVEFAESSRVLFYIIPLDNPTSIKVTDTSAVTK